MRVVPRKLFTLPLCPNEKLILTRLAQASGLSCSAVIRQLLLEESHEPRLKALSRRAR